MTLKTSSVSGGPTKNLFLHFLRKQTAITLLVTAFSLLICPGSLISRLVDSYNYTYDEEMREEIILESMTYGLFTVGVAVLLTIFLLCINFKFLYSKKAADMYYTLPTTRNEMLFSGLFSSVLGGIFCLTIGIGSLAVINALPLWNGIPLARFIEFYLLSVFFLIFLSAFSLIFIVSAGREIDAIISLVGVSGGFPAIYLIATYMYQTFSYGVYLDDMTPVIYTSPFAYAGAKIISFILNANKINNDLDLPKAFNSDIYSFIGTAILTVLFIYISARLYKIRKSETAEQGYSFKFMPAILLGLCSIVGGFLIGLIISGGSPFDSVIFWVFYGIGALLCAVAFEAVHTRGFKTVKSALAKSGIAIALSIVIMASAGIMGAREIYYMPKEEEIDKVFVGDDVVFTDNFDIVLNLHKAIIAEYDKYGGTSTKWSLFGNYYYTDNEKPISDLMIQIDNFMVEYKLKNGKVKTRSYNMWNIDYTELEEEVYAYLTSDEVKEGYYKQIEEMKESGRIWAELNRDNMYYSGEITEEVAKIIIDTYTEEMRTAGVTVFTETCMHLNYSGYGKWHTLRIPLSFEETINVIKLNTTENAQ